MIKLLGAVVMLLVIIRDPPAGGGNSANYLLARRALWLALEFFVVRARSRPQAGPVYTESIPRRTL